MIYRFCDYSLDNERLELRRGADLIDMEPQVFSLLIFLIENRTKVVSKDDLIDAVWQGRIVSDATLNARINGARKAVGDNGKDQAVIRTLPKRGFRFVADVTLDDVSPAVVPPSAPPAVGQGLASAGQQIKFCTASDGVRIAYAKTGHGPPFVKTANWLNHLDYDWESPVWRPMLQELSQTHTLVRYDERGNGLSDWDVAHFSLDAFVDDLEAVVAAAGLTRFPLLGISHGCPVSVAYAVRHPEKVTHLILYGGFVKGVRTRGTAIDLEREEAIATLMREGWGQDNPAFRQIFTSQLIPDATAEQMEWFNNLQRETTSPENAVRLRVAIDEMDVSDLLEKVQVPTLVLHRRKDARQPFAEGRRMASIIPDAQFVALEGRNHIILEEETEWERFFAEINAFVGI